MSLLELFCYVDTFCQAFLPQWNQQVRAHGQRVRQRAGQLAPSEIMTILIRFHQLRFRDFKTYYVAYVLGHLHREFPQAVSYQRFVELAPSTLGPLCAYLSTCLGACSGLSFVDSTALAGCQNRRIPRHRVFRDLAQRGKTSMGWFYGCKLQGRVAGLSAHTRQRRRPPTRAQTGGTAVGRLFGDKGYLSQPLTHTLFQTRRGSLVTHLRRKMINRLLLLHNKVLLRRRALIETVFDQLKHLLQVEHARHRSPTNFAVNLVAGLVAYCHQPKKPSIFRGGRPQLATVIPN